jgi:transcriptional repressor NrdR
LDRETIDALVTGVEEDLRGRGGEVPSDAIGVAVLDRLRPLDQVAYLRFASVYKGFEDAEDFERELGALRADAARPAGDRLEKKAPKAPLGH